MKFLFLLLSFFMPTMQHPDAHRAQPEPCACVGNPREPIAPAYVPPATRQDPPPYLNHTARRWGFDQQ